MSAELFEVEATPVSVEIPDVVVDPDHLAARCDRCEIMFSDTCYCPLCGDWEELAAVEWLDYVEYLKKHPMFKPHRAKVNKLYVDLKAERIKLVHFVESMRGMDGFDAEQAVNDASRRTQLIVTEFEEHVFDV